MIRLMMSYSTKSTMIMITASDGILCRYEISMEFIQVSKKQSGKNITAVEFATDDSNNSKIVLRDYDLFTTLKHFAMGVAKKRDICLCLDNVKPKYKTIIFHMICKYAYKFEKYKSKKSVRKIYVHDTSDLSKIIKEQEIVNMVRDLQNEPANVMYPESFAKHIIELFKDTDVKVTVMDDREIKEKGLNLIHSVGKGNINKPRFVVLEYNNKPDGKRIGLFGKGVCFDNGGTEIKFGANTYEMKSDKAGACIVVGLFKYFSDVKAKGNLVGFLPLVVNSIGSDVMFHGDIIKAYNGTTCEIRSSNSEGRLILADAFGYAKNFRIDYYIDIATLTGWSDVLHCDTSASVFTLNNKIQSYVLETGEEIGERIIALPQWPEYMKYTKSDVANVKNNDFTGCKRPGGFMASMFLMNFVPDPKNWIHFDISNFYTGSLSNGNTCLLILYLTRHLLTKK